MRKRKVILYIAQSLDGFIARKDGDLDWLYGVETEGDAGFSEFYKTVSTIVMGRGTYEHLMTMVPEFPHKDRECFVFSRSKKEHIDYLTYTSEDVGAFVSRLQDEPGSDIWLVGGGDLLATFLDTDSVDEFIISYAPVIIGEGIPMYPRATRETKLKLIEQKTFGQFVQVRYEVLR